MTKFLLAAVLCLVLQIAWAEEAKPKRFQFGSLLQSSEEGGFFLEHAGNVTEYEKAENVTSTRLFKSLTVGIDPMRYRLTMATIPIPANYSGDYSDLVRCHGCVHATFLAIEDLAKKENIPDGGLVILANDLKTEHLNAGIPNLREKCAKLGFLKRLLPIEDECRLNLINNQIPFIENLELPSELDLLSVVKSKKTYFAFKLMFVPFKNATIIYGENQERKALVNLADLVVFEGDAKMEAFCKEIGDNLSQFNQKLLSDVFPVLSGVELPRFVPRLVGNETEHWLRFSGQSGTNIVAPYRYDKSKSKIANLNDAFFFSPCVCVSAPFGDAPNFKVTRGMLEQWEKDNNVQIPANSVILLNTGYWSRWKSMPEKYATEYPGIELDAVKWLVDERKVVGLGIDSLAVDDFSLSSANKWPSHGYLAEKNIPAMINLRFEGVEQFPKLGSRCVFSYLRIDGGTSSPLAIFGLPGYDKFEVGGEKKEEKETTKIQEEHLEPAKKEEEKMGEMLQRWQFGEVIHHQTENCNCTLRDVDIDVFKSEIAEKQKMSFTETNLVVDPSLNKVTTLSQPGNIPVVMTDGCVETLFIKTYELKSIKKRLLSVNENTLVIFLATDLVKLHDVDLIKEASLKKLTLGFFDRVELPADIRNKLIENSLTIYENLACPEGFDPDQIDENKIYYGFNLVFAPFSEETSMADSLQSMQPPRKINLADLVVYDVDEISRRCSKRNVISLSQTWAPAQKIPIVPNITRPHFLEDGKMMSFFDHFGTHLATPAHFVEFADKMDVTNLTETLDRPACLKVDISCGDTASCSISKQQLVDWEKSSGVRIPEGCMVFLVTGFGVKHWKKLEEYQVNYPGLSLEGANWLVEERKVSAVGIDSLLIDDWSHSSLMRYPTLSYLSSKNVVVIENIGGPDLGKMTSDGASICVMSYLRVEGGSGSPVAIYALLPEKPKAPKETPKEAKKAQAAIASQSPVGQVLSVVSAIALLFPGRL